MSEIERRPEGLYDPIDESTASREALHAEQRVDTADQAAVRTGAVVSMLRRLVNETVEMHETNHYVEHLVPIFRGTHRHAS